MKLSPFKLLHVICTITVKSSHKEMYNKLHKNMAMHDRLNILTSDTNYMHLSRICHKNKMDHYWQTTAYEFNEIFTYYCIAGLTNSILFFKLLTLFTVHLCLYIEH